MKSGSLCAFLFALGCAGLVNACSSGDSKPSAGDAGAGGATGAGGKSSVGPGGAQSGGAGGAAGGATGGAAGAAAGGSAGASAGGAHSGGAGGGTPDGGPEAGTGGNPLQQPAYPEVPYPAENQPNADKQMLGKILFWEEQIGSLDNMACGTCHRAVAGGSDPRAATSAAHTPGPDGILDPTPGLLSDDVRGGQGVPHCDALNNNAISDPTIQVTARKPPTYLDAMFALQVFWDGRAGYCKNHEAEGGCFYDPVSGQLLIKAQVVNGRKVGGALEAQASGPPVNSAEMSCANRTWDMIAAKLGTVTPLNKAKGKPDDIKQYLASHPTYPEMFAAAFGNDAKDPADPPNVINARRIVMAIATHERRLTSDQTPWDKWNAGDTTALTARQVEGFRLFLTKGRCSTCHTPPLFTDLSFHFIGFHNPKSDIGLAKTDGIAFHEGQMKTPTLRNVGLREAGGLLHSGEGPGHDLTTVMTLYKQGGLPLAPNDAGVSVDSQIAPLQLNPDEIDEIIDFLRNGLTDPRVRDQLPPFDRPILSTE
jgi:cytochrome c peroxidase